MLSVAVHKDIAEYQPKIVGNVEMVYEHIQRKDRANKELH